MTRKIFQNTTETEGRAHNVSLQFVSRAGKVTGCDGVVTRDQLAQLDAGIRHGGADPSGDPGPFPLEKSIQFAKSQITAAIEKGVEAVFENNFGVSLWTILWFAVYIAGDDELRAIAGEKPITLRFFESRADKTGDSLRMAWSEGLALPDDESGPGAVDYAPLPPFADDFGAEIYRAAGALVGGRIFLNVLPSLFASRHGAPPEPVRQLQLRIDDNDAPGRQTLLGLVTEQSRDELAPLARLGGLVVIDVMNISRSGLVFGRVTVLQAPPTPGGPVILPKDNDGFYYHPPTNALVSKVVNAAGDAVHFHFCCLLDGGKGKASAAEKKRRLILDGVLPPPPPVERPTPQFGVLAEVTLKALATQDLALVASTEIGDPLITEWKNRQTEAEFDRGCQFMRQALREAHKIVFDADFTRLVIEAAEQSPVMLARMLTTARLPFERCWIEGPPTSTDDPVYWGALIRPDPIQGAQISFVTLGNHTVDRNGKRFPPAPAVAPTGLVVDFVNPVPRNRDPKPPYKLLDTIADPKLTEGLTLSEMTLGPEYCRRWRDHPGELALLTSHVGLLWGVPPFGSGFRDMLHNPLPSIIEPLREYMGGLIWTLAEHWRRIIAGCALVSTHVGGGPLVATTTQTGKKAYYRGKFHPAVEYKVLQLLRPVEAPKRFFRRVFPARHDGPLRFHTVIGAWHHRRAPNAVCDHHPRACPIALWAAVEPDDEPTDLVRITEPADHDQQQCRLCKRKRWWVRDHGRGDPAEGMLDKGYEIAAAKHVPLSAAPPT